MRSSSSAVSGEGSAMAPAFPTAGPPTTGRVHHGAAVVQADVSPGRPERRDHRPARLPTMRARSRPVVAVAAVAAASIPLWASAAGAGESYDEFNHTKKTVTVSGVACEIAITSYRQGTTVYASTYMQTPAP